MRGASAAVELKNLNKSFNGNHVLSDLNLTVMPGEFVAIVGKSGSGKSTLLNIIGLLDEADPGSTVRLFGERAPRIESAAARQLLRTKLAYIFQNAALVDQDTVEANLKLAQRYSELPKDKRSSSRKEVLARVGLEGKEKQKVFQLSGGEQQRLALACIQMHPSELILADEPTGSLDPENRDVVMSTLKRLNNRDKTVVVVTHDENVADMADRIIELD